MHKYTTFKGANMLKFLDSLQCFAAPTNLQEDNFLALRRREARGQIADKIRFI